MNRIATTTLALALAAASGSAVANHDDYRYDRDDGDRYGYSNDYNDYDNNDYDNNYNDHNNYSNDSHGYGTGARYDVARVVRVDPIVGSGHQGRNRACGNVSRHGYAGGGYYRDDDYRDGRRYRHSGPSNGTVLGAVVGGALGNLAGHGDGRRAATIAGAVIGGSIGHSVDRDHRYRGRTYDQGRYDSGYGYNGIAGQCSSVGRYGRDGRVIGYDVSFEYNGRVHHTTTSHHPGNTIRVRVDVIAANGRVAGY